MAQMIPNKIDEDTESFGERQVFKALEKLSDEYTVFHSLRWNDRSEKNTVVYGETDFTIFHPRKGIIVIEVKSGYAYSQICILTVKTETASMLNGVEKIGNHTISSTRGNNSVLFTTARKFKGLEADAIIIVDADADTFADEESKRLFYVGASRAKHCLDIIFVGDKSGLADMVNNIGDQKYPTPFVGIARSLNVKPVMN